jgi:peptidoglycan/xylan/chitin deacetylase (PgdA/CDA1 family)
MRADRVITLGVVNPIINLLRFPPENKLPIIMYHSISSNAEKVHPYFRTNTSPTAFRHHLEIMRSEGYTFVTPVELKTRFSSNRPWLGRKCLLLTFDDGFFDFYSEAFPILAEFGASAIAYLPVGYIGTENAGFTGNKHLSWQQASELAQAGIAFGSHSISHSKLSKLSISRVREEIIDSKKEIEDRIGFAVESFSYPYAFPSGNMRFINELEGILIEGGYSWGVSTRIGRAHSKDNRYFLRRLPMNDMDDIALVKAKLGGAYDWLGMPQLIVRVMKNIF